MLSKRASAFTSGKKDDWKWTVMIMQPEFINREIVKEATAAVAKKKKPVSLPLVRFEAFKEGKAAQTLYIGTFSEEGSTIERVHQSIAENGGQLVGKHHEIYLTDPRRTAPEK